MAENLGLSPFNFDFANVYALVFNDIFTSTQKAAKIYAAELL